MIRTDKIQRFLKFAIVGVSGTAVDLTSFFLLSCFFKNTLDLRIIDLVFPVISYELAVINNFLLSYFWVWQDRKGRIPVLFVKYHLVTLAAFLVRYGIFQGVLFVFHISVKTQFLFYLLTYITATLTGMIINFILIEFQVFKRIDGQK